jgi:hypothetical protein
VTSKALGARFPICSTKLPTVTKKHLEMKYPFSKFTVDILDYKNEYLNIYTEEREYVSIYFSKTSEAVWPALMAPMIILKSFAAKKIIGASGAYSSSNSDHVFAVLSVRLYLDINLGQRKRRLTSI